MNPHAQALGALGGKSTSPVRVSPYCNVTAGGGKQRLVHAKGDAVEVGVHCYYALCGDTRAIRGLMMGYMETCAEINCPSCLKILAAKEVTA
jgi:hypothetical protein